MRVPNDVLVIAGGIVVLINLFRLGIQVTPELRALRAGFAILAVFALVQNLKSLGVIPGGTNYEPLGFTAFVVARGFVAARRFLDSERQLLALNNELATARRIQSSVLPRQMRGCGAARWPATFTTLFRSMTGASESWSRMFPDTAYRR